MASVTSLDKDMRKLRLDKYTPQAANECREWIESVLGDCLPSGDLLDALKDGVSLCKLANRALPPPGIKYKLSSMPFVQMENISLFLRACQRAPFNLQPHDVFLTVDLYENKDPAQVLQCLSAFSRVANQAAPSRFPTVVGPRSRSGFMSPQGTGTHAVGGNHGNRGRGISNASNASSAYSSVSKTAGSLTPSKTGDSNSGRWSPTKNSTVQLSPGSVSSWSKKDDEANTAPAWNINQYGYMGGASQGSMGISFGGRRQITSAAPYIPNMAEKERERKEKESKEEKTRLQMEEEERQRRLEQDAEEERARIAEEVRWEEETKNLRGKEKARQEEERRRWEEEERKWKLDEEKRQQEDREAEARLENERRRLRDKHGSRLQGQFLSQYRAENAIPSGNDESSRIKELEQELELARERERQYERERLDRMGKQDHRTLEEHDVIVRPKEEGSKSRVRSRSRPRAPSPNDKDELRRNDEKEYQHELYEYYEDEQLPVEPRPLPEPTLPIQLKPNHAAPSSRPLPNPATYVSPKTAPASTYSNSTPGLSNRTDRFLASNPVPQQPRAHVTYASELGAFDSSAERDAEDHRRTTSQAKTKAGGWASKSLLEREMELERQRQLEWEEGQKATTEAAKKGFRKDGVDGIGGGLDGRFDKGQWAGYTGGDNQNKGSQGIGASRRQIVGPRPPPGR